MLIRTTANVYKYELLHASAKYGHAHWRPTERHRSQPRAKWSHSTPPSQANLHETRSNPILPFMSRSSDCSLSFRISHQNLLHFSVPSHACHMPHQSNSPWFDLPNDTWWWVQIMKLPTVQLPPLSRYFIPLRSKYSHLNASLLHIYELELCRGPDPW
jgi:hypothetical protein